MANEQNLRPKPFTSEYQPAPEKKSRKGIPNRATVFKKFLSLKIGLPDPTDDGNEIKVSLYEAAALGQLSAAAEGSTAAWKEIQDTLHGRIQETLDITSQGKTMKATTVILNFINKKNNDGNADDGSTG